VAAARVRPTIEELKRREFDDAIGSQPRASIPRSRFGTEITHCRTGTGGMT
jgi:hypothetical protein